MKQLRDFELIVESLPFTVSGDVINHHVTLSVGNIHGEILTFCMPGTKFHRKHIPVSSFFVQWFLFNVSWVYRFSSILNMKVRASKSSSLLQDNLDGCCGHTTAA